MISDMVKEAQKREQLLRALLPDEGSKEYVVPLTVGGEVRVTTGVTQAQVGLFNSARDGEPEAMNEITTEPVNYERAEYIHDDEYQAEVNLSGAAGTVDAWFLEVGGELVATGPLGTRRKIGALESLTFEAPLIEIE